jgi:EamA-like transporter family
VVPLVVGIALGELPGTIQAAGIALAVVGIVITACRSDSSEPGQRVAPSGVRRCGCPHQAGTPPAGPGGAGDRPDQPADHRGRCDVRDRIDKRHPGVVAALSTLYPIVTIALARVYLRERVEPRQRVGIALSLSGVVAISAGI